MEDRKYKRNNLLLKLVELYSPLIAGQHNRTRINELSNIEKNLLIDKSPASQWLSKKSKTFRSCHVAC